MYAIHTPTRNLLDEFFRDFERPAAKIRTFQPAVDIAEVDGGYNLRVELPGVAKESVKVEIKENVLTLSGEKLDPQAETKQWRHSEVAYGKFQRSFTLSANIDKDKVGASFENGVLNVTLVHRPEVGPRQVAVQ